MTLKQIHKRSEYRPGTRGNVKMKWPTYLLWSTGSCLNEKYQRDTCNRACARENGPECREHVEKNFRWPKAKLNETVKLSCFGSTIATAAAATPTVESLLADVSNQLLHRPSPKIAYRYVNEPTHFIISLAFNSLCNCI